MAKKLTVTFPDGTQGSRRTDRPYRVAVAGYREVARPEYDIVKHRYTRCAAHDALRATFQPRWDAVNDQRRAVEARVPALEAQWHALYNEVEAAYRAHSAACPEHCDTSGNVRHEVSRKPERTGWVALSWHHNTVLAQKAMATEAHAWTARHFDRINVFPVDGAQ